jgi:nicotinamide mononucleotide transporter
MIEFFLNAYKDVSTTHIALGSLFCFRILSVLFAKGEHLGLSTGLIATIISVYLLFYRGLSGRYDQRIFYNYEFYGWYKWTRKVEDTDNLPITRTNKRKMIGILLFCHVL